MTCDVSWDWTRKTYNSDTGTMGEVHFVRDAGQLKRDIAASIRHANYHYLVAGVYRRADVSFK